MINSFECDRHAWGTSISSSFQNNQLYRKNSESPYLPIYTEISLFAFSSAAFRKRCFALRCCASHLLDWYPITVNLKVSRYCMILSVYSHRTM